MTGAIENQDERTNVKDENKYDDEKQQEENKTSTDGEKDTEMKIIKDVTDTEQVKQACQQMISTLNEDEKEKAARTSYKYFTKSINATRELNSNTSSNATPPTTEERDQYAMAMARRHLLAEKGKIEKAAQNMRNTIKFREDKKVDIIRRCFDPINEEEEDDETIALLKEHRTNLERELMDRKLYVRGKSKDGKSFLLMESHRGTTEFHLEWSLKYYIYTLERALAVTEKECGGEKFIAVLDHSQYKSKMRPPMKFAKELSSCLRDHYCERVEKAFLTDTPFMFRAFWAVLKVLIDPVTKKKIGFVTGDEQKSKFIGEYVDKSQALPFILPDGELELEMDMKRYLYDVPFDSLYDDAKNDGNE